MQQVKLCEMLTVEAAVHGDRNAAYQALLTHPLGPAADQVEAVLEDMLNTIQAVSAAILQWLKRRPPGWGQTWRPSRDSAT